MDSSLALRQLRRELLALLKEAGIKDPAAEVWQILTAALQKPLSRLLAEPDLLINSTLAGQALLWARRRALREPLAYILGKTYFAGYGFAVGPGCLIPRPDSETLLEAAWQILPRQAGRLLILDTFTGSGCLGISLALRLSQKGQPFWLELADNDSQALAWAEKNLARHGLTAFCRLSQADIFPPDAGPFDLISANPPYIASGHLAGLEPEVKDHEPKNALDGQEDGLYYYKELARRAPVHLKEQAWLIVEHGFDQAGPVRDILAGQGFFCQPTRKDFAGNPRVLAAGRPAT